MKLIVADVLDGLQNLPDNHFQCVVTSPPFWGLRDYGTGSWEGGDAGCDHRHQLGGEGPSSAKQNTSAGMQQVAYRDICRKCGARRVDHQIGLESTPDEYVARLVAVFREVRRVLRGDGVCFLELGDSYCSTAPGTRNAPQPKGDRSSPEVWATGRPDTPPGLKPKDLVGIPWRVAFALQADGWWLRSDIIWARNNPMPESVTDRPTKAHSYVFLLTKQSRYFWDQEGVKEAGAGVSGGACFGKQGVDATGTGAQQRQHERPEYTGRNPRSVWTIPTQSFPGQHFATMPLELAIRCIKAGTSPKGACAECGAPFERVVEHGPEKPGIVRGGHPSAFRANLHGPQRSCAGGLGTRASTHAGWQPTCGCCTRLDGDGHIEPPPVPCKVLDPFSGAGTSLLAAELLGHDSVGIELNPEYAAMAERRIAQETRPGTSRTDDVTDAPLFA